MLEPLLEEALAALGEEQSTLRVRLMARLAGALRDQPSLEPRSSLSRKAVEIARRLEDSETLSYALVSMATATWGPDIEGLAAIADEVSRLAEETGDTERALQAQWLHYIPAMTVGDSARIGAVMDHYQALAETLKQPSQQWYGAVLRLQSALLQGDFAQAEQLAEEALRLGERAQSWDAGFSYRLALFTLRREQGRLDEINELIRSSVDEYAGYRLFRCLVTALAFELGRESEARARLDELAAGSFSAFPRDAEWLFCLCVLSEVAARLGDRDRTTTLYDLLLPYGRLNAIASGEVAAGSVSRYLGLLASSLKRWEDATRHFETALEMNERMGAEPWTAHTREDYARMLLERDESGDRERGCHLLDAALSTYRELGMEAQAVRLEPQSCRRDDA